MWLVVFLSVGYTDVLVGCLYELVSQLFFELGGGSIGIDVLQVLVEFELVELFFLELFEGILYGSFGGVLGEGGVFFVGGLFHIKYTVI